MNSIKVSIIIPAYNVENYIERCVKSGMNQTLKEIEVIIVNDGSTDRTQEIIEKNFSRDNKVVIVNKQNEGVSVARNYGVKIAKGEYIQFLDGDDWIEPTACEKMYKFAKKENLDIVVSDLFYDDDNNNITVRKELNSNQRFFTKEEYLIALFQDKAARAVWNKIFVKTLFDEETFPRGVAYGEDFVATVILTSKATKIGKYNDAFVHYIKNPLSTTQNQVSKKIYHLFNVFHHIETYFQRNDHYQTYYDEIEKSKQKIVYRFLKQEPFFGDENYEKGIEKTLEYFKSKPKIYKNLNFSRRLKMAFLTKFPNRKNIVRMIKFHNKQHL
ncbi:MAG: glycosyltransferase family 2 protein [Campylobacterales bacterium]|nr:glycosyltransferase family 2 protein [Campylobacterales bacterium]HEO98714.1 glycosyltransferase family 2 protein [Campylobacterota bacterium]